MRSDEELALWRRLDRPGHEAARLIYHDPFWHLTGTAVFEQDGVPCRVEYLVACSAGWQTLHAKVAGWIGTKCVRVDVASDSHHRWRINGQTCSAVDGCIDLDLEFSPATNVLPIRRLRLQVGERADLTSAWLRFPQLTLEPLVQAYRHTSERTYEYEAHGGTFVTELDVSPTGMILRYPQLWEAEGGHA